MCKFCETKTKQKLLSYNNRHQAQVYYDQYCGVLVEAELWLNGNMLSLKSYGNYRSHSDCYYESAGLEMDNKTSRDDLPNILKLEYCPFCGQN